MQVRGADQVGLETRKLSLAVAGIAQHERFGDEKAQDGIAQEFELLVIAVGRPGGVADFVGVRTMSQRAAQQF